MNKLQAFFDGYLEKTSNASQVNTESPVSKPVNEQMSLVNDGNADPGNRVVAKPSDKPTAVKFDNLGKSSVKYEDAAKKSPASAQDFDGTQNVSA